MFARGLNNGKAEAKGTIMNREIFLDANFIPYEK